VLQSPLTRDQTYNECRKNDIFLAFWVKTALRGVT